jgi:hypothetical protein
MPAPALVSPLKGPGSPDDDFETACGVRLSPHFHRRVTSTVFSPNVFLARNSQQTARNPGTAWKSHGWIAPNSSRMPVDGLHSIEKTILTNLYFSLTLRIEGVKRQSFFDSFLSFSGWCGVRGSSKVTFLTARLGRRASKGL